MSDMIQTQRGNISPENLYIIKELKQHIPSSVAIISEGDNPESRIPFIKVRPVSVDNDLRCLTGSSFLPDKVFACYCCSNSEIGSYKLGLDVMRILDGVNGYNWFMTTSVSYSGLYLDRYYETLVTCTIQGGMNG